MKWKKPIKKTNKYERNHKIPILAMWENPRYTGACQKLPGKCEICKGDNLK